MDDFGFKEVEKRLKIFKIIKEEINKIKKDDLDSWAILNALHADIFVFLLENLKNAASVGMFYDEFQKHFRKIYRERQEELQ